MIRADRPKKGTPERREWVLANIRASFAALGLTRREFTIKRWQETRGEVAPCNDDIAAMGGWAAACVAALGDLPVPVAAIPVGHRLRGVSTLVGPDGTVKAQWVKTREEEIDREEVLARLMETLPERVTAREGCVPAPKGPARADLIAVYPIGDAHVGLRSWKTETGADFDLEIAERLMTDAIRDLVLRGPRTERALIVNLGDFLHADQGDAHTTHGTHTLDMDGRMAKVLGVGLRILTTFVDAALERHDRVELDNIPGNHDAYTAIMLAIAMREHYRNEPRVSVPVEPATRHYHRFGRVLIGTVHGDRTKLEALGEIMAAERAEDWGATKHRTWLVGHVHHSQVKELRGCTVETFRTLAARDAWHAGQGYVAGRDMRRIVYHREHGEISREIAGLDYLEHMAVAA